MNVADRNQIAEPGAALRAAIAFARALARRDHAAMMARMIPDSKSPAQGDR